MKEMLIKIVRGEKGQALPIALAMLALGSLVITPLLNLTETSLRSGISEEDRMYEHYAANAGISDGLLNILTDDPQLPAAGDNWSYGINSTNSRSVNVVIMKMESGDWKITSTATSSNGDNTEINCYAAMAGLIPNALSATKVTIDTGVTINGNVQWESPPFKNNGTINGEIINKAINWPDRDDIPPFYLEQLQGAPTHEGHLNLTLGPETMGDPYALGPLYINGNLNIYADPNGAVRLYGNLYVEGQVFIAPNITTYMNNFTIFTNSSFTVNQASAAMRGYGCIVAKQGITFYSSVSPGNYLILWSLEAATNVSTASQINGAVYAGGNAWIGNGTINWAEPPPGLMVPPFRLKIVGWESNQY